MEIHPPHAPAHSFKDFAIQLLTIAAGVLIALSFEGVREWNHYRTLVSEAKENISREITDNKRDIENVLGGVDDRKRKLANALHAADELIATRTLSATELSLSFELADRVNSAAWQTAEQTGALAHMDFADVQRYARLYAFQDLYIAQQRRALEALTQAIGILTSGQNPTTAPAKDIEVFRARVLDLQSILTLEEQLGRKLVADYASVLSGGEPEGTRR